MFLIVGHVLTVSLKGVPPYSAPRLLPVHSKDRAGLLYTTSLHCDSLTA